MATVLSFDSGAALSHGSAAALMGIRPASRGTDVEVTVRVASARSRRGVRVHRRPGLRWKEVGTFDRIPVTSPVQTLIDLATRLDRSAQERAVSEADRLGLVTPPALRRELDSHAGEPGVRVLRQLLDRRTFRLTRSKLEQYFLPLANQAGLPVPETKRWVNGYEVDFYWPGLRLVVETDGLTYHRTPAQQAEDRRRDQAHTAAGLTPLRFTHEQVYYEPAHVLATLSAVAQRLLTVSLRA
jgi:very-short-patch-repair endonuclease